MRRFRGIVIGLLVVGVLTTASVVLAQEGGGGGGTESNYFNRYFKDGGWVVWFIEFPMSVAMLALIIMYGLEVRGSNQLPQSSVETIRGLLDARQYREAIEYTSTDPSMISHAMNSALKEASRGYPAMERAMEDALDERVVMFMRKIEYLNVFGNLGPMIGLFGTVLGMIASFTVMHGSATPKAQDLALGIAEALVCTLWGLFIALPSLTAFALLRNRIESNATLATLKAQEMLSMFNPAAMRAAASAQAPAAKPAAAAAPAQPATQA